MTALRASLLVFAAIAAVIAAGCATKPAADAPVRDAVLTLQEMQTLPLGDTISLRYERADDSRCPSNVKCIWAGKIVYQFTLIGRAGAEPLALEADTPAFESQIFKGVRLVLGATEPPPRGMAHETPPHPVTVSITNT
ncbi:hypothetical protein [Massilia cavernae]|uniref:Lipoprotein n=1 Tax=Massilia cavernae TaxID=2320864 RepID=A0A418XAD6_9BURK|nr:hypothetical protein [Massilia cavernae]RJG09440.1 hypothetical protein D3872_22955 [Massilia cavernae]